MCKSHVAGSVGLRFSSSNSWFLQLFGDPRSSLRCWLLSLWLSRRAGGAAYPLAIAPKCNATETGPWITHRFLSSMRSEQLRRGGKWWLCNATTRAPDLLAGTRHWTKRESWLWWSWKLGLGCVLLLLLFKPEDGWFLPWLYRGS